MKYLLADALTVSTVEELLDNLRIIPLRFVPTMQGRLTRWLVPATCIALAVVGWIWLSRDRGTANESPSGQATQPRSATQQDGRSPLHAKDNIGSNAEGRDSASAVPLPARPQEYPSTTLNPGLLLGFQSPSSANTGEAFDVHVVVDGRQALERIALEIEYDPAVLRLRDLEAVDYSRRASGERTFSITDRLGDRRAVAVLTIGGDTWGPAYRVRAAVAQFEALAPGSAKIRISNIEVSDRAGRSIDMTASGQEIAIVLN